MCTAGLPSGVSRPAALLVLVINLFLPGVGTILAAFLGRSCACDTVLVGLLQLLTAPLLLFGWVWALCWSIGLRGKAKGGRDVRDVEKGDGVNTSPTHSRSHAHSHPASHSRSHPTSHSHSHSQSQSRGGSHAHSHVTAPPPVHHHR